MWEIHQSIYSNSVSGYRPYDNDCHTYVARILNDAGEEPCSEISQFYEDTWIKYFSEIIWKKNE